MEFQCPICRYRGAFADVTPVSGLRRHARCPECRALERHRVQHVVLERLFADIDPSRLRVIHFAPEPFFKKYFSGRFAVYHSADLLRPDVDCKVDLTALPFPDRSYDFVFASHVLEHIPDDISAIAEIQRILRPAGIAVLPVPVVAEHTVEYAAPNPNEFGHVRSPGFDYFDKFEGYFTRIEQFDSTDIPEHHQPFIYEDRTRFPTAEAPLRPPMPGARHLSVVPVCYV